MQALEGRKIMGQIKWYKRDPDAALSGMMGLSLEERGAYNTVLDLIYTRDGNLPDDERFVAGWLGVDVRVWRRIKNRLIDLGKLYVTEGMLRNSRADVEVLSALSRVGSAQDAGRASARSKARKSHGQSHENNNLASATVETDASTTVSTNHNHNQIEEPNGSSPPEGSTPRKSREHGTNERAEGLNPRSTGRNPRANMEPDPGIPDWIPTDPWNAFLEMRIAQKKPPTKRAISLLIGKLERLRSSGHDPGAVLDQSTLRNWTDIYEIKDGNHGQRQQSTRDRRDGFEQAADRRIFGN
jgi:uncharacterized protein YdaU (DUF1376 family)